MSKGKTPDDFHNVSRPVDSDLLVLAYNGRTGAVTWLSVTAKNLSVLEVVTHLPRALSQKTSGELIPLCLVDKGVRAFSPVLQVVDDGGVGPLKANEITPKIAQDIAAVLPKVKDMLSHVTSGFEAFFLPGNGKGLGSLRFMDPTSPREPGEGMLPKKGVAQAIRDLSQRSIRRQFVRTLVVDGGSDRNGDFSL